MEHIIGPRGADVYRVWADPEMSGIEPTDALYSSENVRDAVRQSLLALREAYPEKMDEVNEIIRRYNLQKG
jgi:hypothetical protein